MIITIDGPAGSGKSTLAKNIAEKMYFFCLNNGYLYRGLAYILQNVYGYNLDTLHNLLDENVVAILQSGEFYYTYEQSLSKIIWQKVNITPFLKDPIISQAAAIIAQQKHVRTSVLQYQHQLAQQHPDIVVEGRASGTELFPNADLKLYLTAAIAIRAQRFVFDQKQRQNYYTEQEAITLISNRDSLDYLRKNGALAIPQDAIVLDSSRLNQEELLQKVMNLIKRVKNKGK